MVEQLFRSGGETVYVSSDYPNGLLPAEYRRLIKSDPGAALWRWRMLRRNMEVYARGAVSHADHATVNLPFWHRVMMNTETQSRATANVAFLD